MILHVVSGQIAPSIGNAAGKAVVAWSKKWLSTARGKWPDHDFQFLTMARGKNGVAQWTGKYQSFADWEEFFTTIYQQDPDIRALYEEGDSTAKELGGPFLAESETSFYEIHEPA